MSVSMPWTDQVMRAATIPMSNPRSETVDENDENGGLVDGLH